MFLCTYWLMYCLMDLRFLAVFIFLVKCFQYWVKVCSFLLSLLSILIVIYCYWLFFCFDCCFFCDSFFLFIVIVRVYVCRFSGHSDGVIPGLVSIPEVKSVTFCLVLWRYLWEFHFAASLFFILFCITLLYCFLCFFFCLDILCFFKFFLIFSVKFI